MTFDEYQKNAIRTDISSKSGGKVLSVGFMDKVLGLVGESGEVAEKIKKVLRDKNGELSEDDKQELIKELGDVLWYIALISHNLDVPMNEVAKRNNDKLLSRLDRDALGGSGDNR